MEEPIKIIVRWRTKEQEWIDWARRRFGFPTYTNINGWTPAYLQPQDKRDLDECVDRGFLTYQQKEWTSNGATVSW